MVPCGPHTFYFFKINLLESKHRFIEPIAQRNEREHVTFVGSPENKFPGYINQVPLRGLLYLLTKVTCSRNEPMAINKVRTRKLHRMLAPIMVLPLLLTLITGSLFQMAVVSGKTSEFIWLLDLHRGKFGSINLDKIYPFLNAIGLLTLLITGIIMWFQIPSRRTKG